MLRVLPFRLRRTSAAGVLVLATFALPGFVALPGLAEQPESRLGSLRRDCKKRQEAARSLDVSWHSSRSLLRSYAQRMAAAGVPPAQSAANDHAANDHAANDHAANDFAANDFVTFDAKLRFVIDAAGRTRMEHSGQVPALGSGDPTAEESVEVIADDVQKVFFAVGGIGFPAYHEKPEPRSRIVDGRVLPLLLALRAVDADRPVLDVTSLAETGQEVQLDGCKCLVFKHSRGEIWVDPARDHVPVRYLEMPNNRTTRDIVIRYAAQAEIGWVPFSWNSVKLDSKTGAVLESLVADDVRLQVNPQLAPGTFSIELPVGTWVNKQPVKEGDRGETYLLRADGKRPVAPGEYDGRNYQELLTTDPPSGFSRTTGVVMICLLGLGAGAVLWRVKSRSGRTPTA